MDLPGLDRLVFEQWAWTQAIKRGLRFVMEREETYHYHQGDRKKTWDLFLTRMGGTPMYWYSQHSKLAKLEEDNPGFVQAWMEVPNDIPHLISNIIDQPYWKRIAAMYFFRYVRLSALSHQPRLDIRFNDPPTENSAIRMENPTTNDALTARPGPNRSGGGTITIQLPSNREFEIWQIVHICSTFERGSGYRGKVREALRDCDFENLYDRIEDGFARKGPYVGIC